MSDNKLRALITQWFLNHPHIKITIQFLFMAVPFGFIANSLYKNWEILETYNINFNFFWIGLSTTILLFSLSLLPLATKIVFGAMGHKLPFFSVFTYYFIAQLSKYLPGGVWIVPSRIVMFTRFGISEAEVSLGLGIELIFLIITGILNFIPYYILFPGTSIQYGMIILCVLFLLIFFFCYTHKISNFLYRKNDRHWAYRLKTKNIKRSLFCLLIIDLFFWICIGIGLYFLVAGFNPVKFEKIFIISGSFSFAWVMGFLAFLTPSGLGVREGVLLIFFSPFFPAPFPAIISLVARIWWTFGDIIMAIIAFLTAKFIIEEAE